MCLWTYHRCIKYATPPCATSRLTPNHLMEERNFVQDLHNDDGVQLDTDGREMNAPGAMQERRRMEDLRDSVAEGKVLATLICSIEWLLEAVIGEDLGHHHRSVEDPSVCKSNGWLHVDILWISFIKLGYILL
jgi:hypothetical protein